MSNGREMPWFDDSKFDTEFLSKSPHIRQYCLELKNVKRRAMGNPLHPGLIMSPRFQIDPVQRPPDARPPPPFALSGGVYQLRLHRAIQPFRGDCQWSQVWLAEAFDPETKINHGAVIVKIFQQSFFLNPMDPDGVIDVSRTQSALRLAATENHMYMHMTQIQGLHVPYCFGMYQVRSLDAAFLQLLMLILIRSFQCRTVKLCRPFCLNSSRERALLESIRRNPGFPKTSGTKVSTTQDCSYANSISS